MNDVIKFSNNSDILKDVYNKNTKNQHISLFIEGDNVYGNWDNSTSSN